MFWWREFQHGDTNCFFSHGTWNFTQRTRASVNIPYIYIITSRANLVNSNETMMQRENKSANKSTGEQIKQSLVLSSTSDPSYCVNHNLSCLPILHQKHDVCLCVYSIETGLVYVLLLRVKSRQCYQRGEQRFQWALNYSCLCANETFFKKEKRWRRVFALSLGYWQRKKGSAEFQQSISFSDIRRAHMRLFVYLFIHISLAQITIPNIRHQHDISSAEIGNWQLPCNES